MARRFSRPTLAVGTNRRAEVVERIPRIYEALRSEAQAWPDLEAIVVVYHSRDRDPHYGICTLQGEPHPLINGESRAHRAALGALRETHIWHLRNEWLPPDVFVAFDVATGQAWYGKTLESVNRREDLPNFEARTLRPIDLRMQSSGQPPHLAPRAEIFAPQRAWELAERISEPDDRPEETFLLEMDLLRLAVDSLTDADVLDPLPVHLNGLWVFARPVVMQRPNGTDRFVRAVWFRQGKIMWRIRTYTAGTTMRVKDVGELAGQQPFVAVWDETRPEQKLLAAVWALMTQGGVTETGPSRQRPIVANDGDEPDAERLQIVRLKAGSEHAQVYGADRGDAHLHRGSWSVRGHWRHQPYRSLGVDESGKVRTRPIWIASYVKGDSDALHPGNKVIVVRP